MSSTQRSLLLAATLLAIPAFLHADNQGKIISRMQSLRSLNATERPAATVQLATDIRALPPSPDKVKLADSLAHLVTEGDQGQDTIQAVADALRQSLAESPVPAKKGEPPMPYMDLANLVRYEHASAELSDPLYAQASPVKRIGRDRFMRNVLIAIGNSRDARLAPDARRLLADFSPLVRAMAVWALSRLLDPPAFASLREDHMPREDDADVRREWAEAR